MKKIILPVSLVVILVAVGLVWWAYSSLDEIVREAIERHGTEAAGSPVLVESVQLSLSLDQGQGVIEGLVLRNPEGFPEGNALRIGRIEIEVDTASATSNPIVIQSVRLLEPEVNFLMNAALKSNFDVLRENLQERKASPEASESSTSETLRIVIREFILGDGKVTAQVAAFGENSLDIELVGAEQQDLGAPNGVAPRELARDLLNRVSRQVLVSTAQRGLEQLIDEKLGGKAGNALKEILGSVVKP